MNKERLDILILSRGLASSREAAKRLIMTGNVLVNGQAVDKPGTTVGRDAEITLKEIPPYVSRGGLKLKRALDVFGISVCGKVAVDVGASTGGFTDCLLQEGAERVYAVDVGYGQLAEKLRRDSRVTVIERKNARNLKPEDIGEKADIITIDVSFISLEKVLSPAKALLKEDGIVIALIKPQFEAGRENVGKNGVVRSAEIHNTVIEKTVVAAVRDGLYLKNLTYSPIKGPKGNIEFLGLFDLKDASIDMNIIPRVVKEAHDELSEGVL